MVQFEVQFILGRMTQKRRTQAKKKVCENSDGQADV